MTRDDELAIRQLPGAFDRLTDALHDAARRRRNAVIAFLVLLGAAMGGTYFQSRSNGQVLQQQSEVLGIVRDVTGPEAQARSAATLQRAINELRRSIDCAELANEAAYPACLDVVARLDAIRSGADPFAPVTTTTIAPSRSTAP